MKRVLAAATCFVCLAALVLASACDSSDQGLVLKLSGHTWWVESVAWSPDGKYVASSSTDTSVRVWDVSTGTQVAQLYVPNGAEPLAWSPDGKYLAVGSPGPGDTLYLFGVANWHLMRSWSPASGGWVTSVSWSPNSQYLAIGDITGLYIWKPTSNNDTILASLSEGGGTESMGWSPDGKSLVFSIVLDPIVGEVLSWEPQFTARRSISPTVVFSSTNNLLKLAQSPSGSQLAIGSTDGTVKVVNATSSQTVTNLVGHGEGVTSVTWSPDGKMIASGSGDRTVRVWDVATWKNIATYTHGDIVNDVAWSPDSTMLAVACADHLVYLWRAPTAKSPPSSSTP